MTLETQPICVDDFGDLVYRCHWTGLLVFGRDVIWTGAIIPGVKVRHAAAPGFESSRMAARESFDAAEKNCNTCSHLIRVKHAKCKFGFLYGRCASQSKQWSAHPYKDRFQGDIMIFHPNDWMGMPCYEPRSTEACGKSSS